MRAFQLFDDAQSDLTTHDEVSNVYIRILNRLQYYHKTLGDNIDNFSVSINGEQDALLFYPHHLTTDDTFLGKTLLILQDGNGGGSFYPNVKSLGCPAIFVDTINLDTGRPFVLGVSAKETLYHELIHAHQILKRGIPVTDTGQIADREDKTDYYNNPLEFDARFHQISQELNNAINLLKNEVERGNELDDDVIEMLIGNISLDPTEFIQNLQRNAKPWSSQGKNLWYYALPDKRKRMITRLYKLHTYLRQYIKKHGTK